MANIIKYVWDDVDSIQAGKDGFSIAVKEGVDYPKPSETYPKPAGGVYPKPIATDCINVVIDSKSLHLSDDGTLVIPDVVITKEMVQDYDGVKMLKCADELEQMVKFMDGRPVTDGHPKDQIVTCPGQIKGFIRNPRFASKQAICDILIFDKGLIADVTDGKKREVSVGIQCDFEHTPGKLGDAEYSEVQRNILLDHVAIIEGPGRCSFKDGCGIKVDAATQVDAAKQVADAAVIEEAKKIIDCKKQEMVKEIKALTDSRDAEKLAKMTIEELSSDLVFLRKVNDEAKAAAKLNLGGTEDPRKAIDLAYAKISR